MSYICPIFWGKMSYNPIFLSRPITRHPEECLEFDFHGGERHQVSPILGNILTRDQIIHLLVSSFVTHCTLVCVYLNSARVTGMF